MKDLVHYTLTKSMFAFKYLKVKLLNCLVTSLCRDCKINPIQTSLKGICLPSCLKCFWIFKSTNLNWMSMPWNESPFIGFFVALFLVLRQLLKRHRTQKNDAILLQSGNERKAESFLYVLYTIAQMFAFCHIL